MENIFRKNTSVEPEYRELAFSKEEREFLIKDCGIEEFELKSAIENGESEDEETFIVSLEERELNVLSRYLSRFLKKQSASRKLNNLARKIQAKIVKTRAGPRP